MLEIIVNNEKIDLPTDVNAVFNFDFLNIEDFSKIGAAYSYTLNLPKTPKNQRIFGFANRLDAVTNIPYLRIVAIVRLFGVEIDNAANLKITSFDGKNYNVNILLNVSDISAQLGEKTLQDLDLGFGQYNRTLQNYFNHSVMFGYIS